LIPPSPRAPRAPQIKAIWSVMLRNFDFELLDPVPEADYDSMVIGPKAARVRYTRRKL
jgi:sterol 14-demethylase